MKAPAEESLNTHGNTLSKVSKKEWIRTTSTLISAGAINVGLLNPDFGILSDNGHLSYLNQYVFYLKGPIVAFTGVITFTTAHRIKCVTEGIDLNSIDAIRGKIHESIKGALLASYFAYTPDLLGFDREAPGITNQIIEAFIYKVKSSIYALSIPFNLFDSIILKHLNIDGKGKVKFWDLFKEKYWRQMSYTLSLPPYLGNNLKEKGIDFLAIKSGVRNTLLFAITPNWLLPFVSNISDAGFSFFQSTNIFSKVKAKDN